MSWSAKRGRSADPFLTFLTAELMTTDPSLTPEQIARVNAELSKCERLLAKLWHEDSRREVMARRRALFRILYGIPQGVPLPIDWKPEPHPQTADLNPSSLA